MEETRRVWMMIKASPPIYSLSSDHGLAPDKTTVPSMLRKVRTEYFAHSSTALYPLNGSISSTALYSLNGTLSSQQLNGTISSQRHYRSTA